MVSKYGRDGVFVSDQPGKVPKGTGWWILSPKEARVGTSSSGRRRHSSDEDLVTVVDGLRSEKLDMEKGIKLRKPTDGRR